MSKTRDKTWEKKNTATKQYKSENKTFGIRFLNKLESGIDSNTAPWPADGLWIVFVSWLNEDDSIIWTDHLELEDVPLFVNLRNHLSTRQPASFCVSRNLFLLSQMDF